MTLNEVIADLTKLVELNPLAGEMQVLIKSSDYNFHFNEKSADTANNVKFSDDNGKNVRLYPMCVLIG